MSTNNAGAFLEVRTVYGKTVKASAGMQEGYRQYLFLLSGYALPHCVCAVHCFYGDFYLLQMLLTSTYGFDSLRINLFKEN